MTTPNDTTVTALPDGNDPTTVQAVKDIVTAVFAAADRVKAENEAQRLSALRLTDLHNLITAAIAEPGTVPTDHLLREAAALATVASDRAMQPIWHLLSRLEEVQPTPPPPADVADWAEHLCYVSITTKPWKHMEPAPAALYHAGCALLENEAGSLEITMGHVLMLDALIASPDAAQRIVERVRRMLVESDDRLAMFRR